MKKLMAIFLAVLLLLATVAGCTSKDDGKKSENPPASEAVAAKPALKGKDIRKEQIKIAYIPNSTMGSVHEVSQMAADDVMIGYPNVNIVFFDAKYDSTTQIEIISECIAQQYDAIIMECTDAVAINSVIREAEEAGIVVITTNQGCTTLHSVYLSNDAYSAGWLVGQLMVEDLGGSGDVILLDCPAPLVPVVLHGKGFQDYIAEHPGIKLIDYANIDAFSQENAYAAMRDLLTKHDKIDAVYAMGDDMAIGVTQAIESAGRGGEGILVYGSEGVPQAIEAIRVGTLRATVWGDRYTMLYMAFNMALLYIDAGMNSVSLGYEETPSIITPFFPITQKNVESMVPYIRYSSLWPRSR